MAQVSRPTRCEHRVAHAGRRRAARADPRLQRLQLRRHRRRARGQQGEPALPLPHQGGPRRGGHPALHGPILGGACGDRRRRVATRRPSSTPTRASTATCCATTACACAACSRRTTRRCPSRCATRSSASSTPVRPGSREVLAKGERDGDVTLTGSAREAAQAHRQRPGGGAAGGAAVRRREPLRGRGEAAADERSEDRASPLTSARYAEGSCRSPPSLHASATGSSPRSRSRRRRRRRRGRRSRPASTCSSPRRPARARRSPRSSGRSTASSPSRCPRASAARAWSTSRR